MHDEKTLHHKPYHGRAYRLAAAIMFCSALAACSSSGTGALDEMEAETGAAPPAANTALFDPVQDPRAYCPKIVMRAGTQTMDVFPDDVRPDDPDRAAKLRYRGTITELVRECNYGGPNLYIKVGVAGRVLSGPGGESGSFTMPIRVAITEGGEVLYSQLHDVAVEIPPGRTNGQFTFVDDSIVLPKPENENLVIYAGYDEQRVDLPGARPAEGEGRQIN